MSNIILVAGTHHGGWYWQPMAEELEAQGHSVFTPTLAGLDDQAPHPNPINLDTHIDDVLRVIDENQLADVVLVGHSYAGMVITGAADKTSAKVKGLVYLDAALPEPGQSEWDLNSDWLRERYVSTTIDGINVDVPAEFLAFRPRLMPHPIATKLQPLFYSRAKFDGFNKVYVHAARGFGSGLEHFFERGYERASTEPGWTTYSIDAGHDLTTDAPDEVLQIILQLSK